VHETWKTRPRPQALSQAELESLAVARDMATVQRCGRLAHLALSPRGPGNGAPQLRACGRPRGQSSDHLWLPIIRDNVPLYESRVIRPGTQNSVQSASKKPRPTEPGSLYAVAAILVEARVAWRETQPRFITLTCGS